MNINLIKQLIIDQREKFLDHSGLIKREIKEGYGKLIDAKQIIVITGVRRAGKSSFLKLLAQELFETKKINPSQLFYLNFDDEFFVNFKKEDFNSLLSAFYESGADSKKKIYCFFDEIQNIAYWEKWVNKLYETGKFKIFVTGSNSTLLSSEIATSLTGRNYPLEIFPFSFREYLTYKKIPIPRDELTTPEKAKIKKEFDSYLKHGGFPETLESKLDILEEYYKNIIYKDIIGRYKIRNINDFRELSFYLMSNITSPATYRSLAKVLYENSKDFSAMTARKFIAYLENSYLFFMVKKFEPSIRKQMVNPFKVYGIDNGMIKSVAFSVSDNHNVFYENLVFLQLRKQRDNKIFYFSGKYEADFVVTNKNKVSGVYQVSYNLDNQKTLDRERRGLMEALEQLGFNEGYVLSEYLEKEEKIGSKKIIYLPLWKWLLRDKQ